MKRHELENFRLLHQVLLPHDCLNQECYGIPEGLRAATGGGNNMMAAIGAGATRGGVAVLSLRTSGTIFARRDRPCEDSWGLIADFIDATGAWLSLCCVMNATSVSETLGALLQSQAEAHQVVDPASLAEVASRVEPGSEGLLLMSFLRGEDLS